jgi:hypothetical protein
VVGSGPEELVVTVFMMVNVTKHRHYPLAVRLYTIRDHGKLLLHVQNLLPLEMNVGRALYRGLEHDTNGQ